MLSLPLMGSLTIIIVNWNTRERLRACLASLPAAARVIVVDNASKDGSAEMVRVEYPNITLIANGTNRGYAAATNQALAQAVEGPVLLLNPDVELAADTIPRALECLAKSDVVAAKLVDPSGLVQRSVRGFPTPAALLFEITGLAKLFPRNQVIGAYRMAWFDYDRGHPATQPMMSFLLISRRALDTVGGLDERFPIFFNDVDWCRRAHCAGIRLWFCPDALATHHGGAATRLARRAMIWESHRSLLRYLRMHYSWCVTAAFAPVVWLGALVRARGYSRGFADVSN